MNSTSLAAAPERRALNYWFQDGLPALVGGVAGLFYGFFLLFDGPAKLVFELLAFVIVFGHRPILKWLKTRITYPRTGCVTPPHSSQDSPPPVADVASFSLQTSPEKLAEMARRRHEMTVQTIVIIAVLAPVTLGMMFINSPWVYAISGAAIALGIWFLERKDARSSWIVISGIPLIGLYLSIFPPLLLRHSQRAGYFAAACGVLFIVKGAIALARYLWRNPVASVPAE